MGRDDRHPRRPSPISISVVQGAMPVGTPWCIPLSASQGCSGPAAVAGLPQAVVQNVLSKLGDAEIVRAVGQDQVGGLSVDRVHLVHHICVVDHVTDLRQHHAHAQLFQSCQLCTGRSRNGNWDMTAARHCFIFDEGT